MSTGGRLGNNHWSMAEGNIQTTVLIQKNRQFQVSNEPDQSLRKYERTEEPRGSTGRDENRETIETPHRKDYELEPGKSCCEIR